MTLEEMQKELEELKATNAALTEAAAENIKKLEDLTAERDSLAEELTSNKENMQQLQSELGETKKLNFTLARSLDVGQKNDTPEELLAGMFIKGGSRA